MWVLHESPWEARRRYVGVFWSSSYRKLFATLRECWELSLGAFTRATRALSLLCSPFVEKFNSCTPMLVSRYSQRYKVIPFFNFTLSSNLQ